MYHNPLTPEDLIEALQKSQGFIHHTCEYLYQKTGHKPSRHTIKARIKEWGMEEFLEDIRLNLVESCKRKAFYKAAADGDNHCLFWILNRYGHHLDFLDAADAETESKRGWKTLLEHVKTTKPETGREPQE